MRNLPGPSIAAVTVGVIASLNVGVASAGGGNDACLIQPEQQVFSLADVQSAQWGTSVALWNGIAAVGSMNNRVRIVQQEPDVGWVIKEELAPPDATQGFGAAVAIRDGVLIVGAPLDDTHGIDMGAAYIFRFNGSHWVFEAKLVTPDTAFNDQFGSTVAIEGNVIIIGAPRVQVLGNLRGAVYVYRFDGNNWNYEQKLQPNLSSLNQFGRSIAANNGELLICGGYGIGTVFVFGFDGTSWVQTQLIQHPGISQRVAAAGHWAVVGQPGSNSLTGSAAIFHRQRTGWVFHSQITAGPTIGFGYIMSLAIDGDWIVVGSPVQNISYPNPGIVRAFRFDGTDWIKAMDLGGTPTVVDHSNTYLGASVAVHQGRVIAGAPLAWAGANNGGMTCVYPLLHACDRSSFPDLCDIADCNHNQIPDECEIASAPASDCNLNTVPDECETAMIYKVDDGSSERAWGTHYMNFSGYDFIWLNQFEVLPGMEIIDRLSITWPSQVGGGFPITLLVYRDQNNDGDPRDAQLLRSASRWTKNTGNGNQPVTKFAFEQFAPTYLGPPGQKFFVGVRVACPAGTYPIAEDNTSPPQHRGWSAFSPFGESNIDNIAMNSVIHAPGAQGSIPGNFTIRALVTDCNLNGVWDGCDIADGTSTDVNTNGIPDECEHCRADFAPRGGNGTVDVDDLMGVLDHWSATGPDPADVTADGEVDVDDLLAVINAFGPCP